jgi:hypothetical protein
VLAVEGAGVDLGEVDEHAGAEGALLGEELAQARRNFRQDNFENFFRRPALDSLRNLLLNQYGRRPGTASSVLGPEHRA